MRKKLLISIILLSIFSCGTEQSDFSVRDKSVSSEADSEKGEKTAFRVPAYIPPELYKPGEVIVKFREGVRGSEGLVHQRLNAEVIRKVMGNKIQVVRIPDRLSVPDAIQQYMEDPSVEYAEPNYIIKAQVTPNDPYFNQQWGITDVNAPQAWDVSTGSNGIVVAVIDTGIDYNHPDISGNIWTNPGEIADGIDNDGNGFVDDIRGWDFVNYDNAPFDDNSHGTHVAGIIGAVGNNGIGMAGMNWKVRLMPLKILDAEGIGDIASEIAAISYAIEKGVRIINVSFGGQFFSISEKDAIQSAKDAGILYIAAAGNGGDDSVGDDNDLIPFYPSSYDLENIVSVTSTGPSGGPAYFANYGKVSVDLGAPGVSILSTVPSSYDFFSGTSMSTAFISGLSALMYSSYGSFNYSQIKGLILLTVDPISALQGLTVSGGKMNAYRAITSLLPPSGLSVTLLSQNEVRVEWTDNSSAEDGFIIERRDGEGAFIIVGTTDGNTETYSDSTISDGRSYAYRVRGFITGIGEGLPSGEVSMTTPLSAPTDLVATGISSLEIRLNWKDNSSSEEGYIIERAIAGLFDVIATVGSNVQEYTDSGLEDTEYLYRVKAFNSVAGESDYSNVATGRPLSNGTGGGGGGGGGGCSLSSVPKSVPTAITDVVLLILPLLVLVWLRRNNY